MFTFYSYSFPFYYLLQILVDQVFIFMIFFNVIVKKRPSIASEIQALF